MNTELFLRMPLFGLLLALCLGSSADAAGFSEPPLVVYGKVFNRGGGGGYQLFSGKLHVTLIERDNPAHTIRLDIPLRRVGANGEFSYRVEVDQNTAPASDKLSTTLVVREVPAAYIVQSATVNGYPAQLADPAQAAQLSTSFAERGQEHRFDLKVDFPTPDLDRDGLPDWWEILYGVSPTNKQDALQDPDGDGWNNLREFQIGTDPTVANITSILQNTLLVIPAGGTAGIYLQIVDADTAPAGLQLKLLDGGSGLVWKRSATPLAAGDTLTYADILAGAISVEAAASFQNDVARFELKDTTSAGQPTQELAVRVEGFSPALGWIGAPSVWLDAERLAASPAVGEWPDSTAFHRDGYQPDLQAQPASDGQGRVDFSSGQFLYLDDKELALAQDFTAFMMFDPAGGTAAEQALFSSSDLNIGWMRAVDSSGGAHLRVLQSGRETFGSGTVPPGGVQLTLASDAVVSLLRLGDLGHFESQLASGAPRSAHTTLGGTRPFQSAAADSFFEGALREFVVYERSLSAAQRALVEDYQRSRWERIRVWNYRGATLPLTLHGDSAVRNSMAGGESNDEIVGGDQADILRGGRGNNILTGGRGADRFCFTPGAVDAVTDFSEAEHDVIDLTEVLAEKTGDASDYITVRTVLRRGQGNVPIVDSIVELKYSGTGQAIDQTITLQGVGMGESDLVRLVQQGNLQLGPVRFGLTATTGTPTPTPKATTTSTPQATATQPPGSDCVGDCGSDGQVTVDEILLGINIVLGNLDGEACPAFDENDDGAVMVDEIVLGINAGMNGCYP